MVTFIRVGKVCPNIAQSGGTEERIAQGMREDIGIGMPKESTCVRDRNPADDERSSFSKAVKVDPHADAGFSHWIIE